MTRAFDGIRVLDLTQSVAGAFSGMHLADHGADVVRLTRDRTPDGRPKSNREVALLCARRSTRTAVPDEWLPDARRLAAKADVVLADGAADTLARQGLDAETLIARTSSLIHVHLPTYGATAVAPDLPEDALLLSALSGVADAHFATKEQPVAPAVPFLLYQQGALGAAAAAAGLIGRQRTGHGWAVRVSGLHAVAIMNAALMLDAPGIVRYDGPKTPLQGAPNYRAYRCRDGRSIFLGTLTPQFFFRFLELIDGMDVMVLPGVDGEFLNLRQPGVQPVAIARLQEVFSTQTLAEWRGALDDAEIPNAPVLTRAEWESSDLVADNAGLVTVEHPTLGPVQMPNVMVELTATPGEISDPGPAVAAREVWDDDRRHPVPVPQTPVATAGPLAGVRVLDLGTFLAGPLAASILCDFGAEVIKVEHPGGDAYRIFTAAFAAVHQGKDNVALDLKDQTARAHLHRLVRDADLLFDNVRPGVQEALGTDAATLHAINPQLVRCTITAWGHASSSAPAFDPLIQAMSGLMVAQGGVDDPVLESMPVHDNACATLAAFGALAALYARPGLGAGQEVKMSLTVASLVIQAGELTTFEGRPPSVSGGPDFLGPDERHRLYRCSDGWIAVAWTADPPPAGVASVLVDGERDLGAALAASPCATALRALTAVQVAAVRVLDRRAIYDDPWMAANNFFRTVDDSVIGEVTVVRGYADWDGKADAAPKHTAGIGENDGKWL
ncbi:CoA transferase [Acidiferrimicrobium sp. IK]|uniref:CoA transferase n=1 Tax=Acidiferrimicrobium sp. IK TaxID=2871700 RepID=UPI0021CAE7FD|nr:CoA transferase [Acidiferrimicrobium sp. IK]MCU4183255.1 CoA transferase [Acidiferrimicrobium sp. IK]